MIENNAANPTHPVVIKPAPLGPTKRPKSPAVIAPIKGSATMLKYIFCLILLIHLPNPLQLSHVRDSIQLKDLNQ